MIQWEDTNLYFSRLRVASESAIEKDILNIDDIDLEGPISQLKSDQVGSGIAALSKLASSIVGPIIASEPRPESLSVDIGLEVSAGGKLVVVHGDVRAHMKLTIKWSSNHK